MSKTLRSRITLQQTLIALIAEAERDPGVAKRAPLTRGLRVDVMIRDGLCALQLSRVFPKAPGADELPALIKAWPTPLPSAEVATNQKRFTYTPPGEATRIYIKTWWTIPPIQGDLFGGNDGPKQD